MRIEIKKDENNHPTAYIELEGLKPVVIIGVPVEFGMEYHGTNTEEFYEMESNSDETREICSKVMDTLLEIKRLDENQ
ncbi:hypothetical protein [Salinicoccus roseus]|uniref:Uncharacterized protein n=1 Tax=Salinicoccus roseus TaxID=45670 RepID=A0A265E6J8_9STAP|nr:hypothetical protein [Salinicoccus roseus]OZT77140.1 hypothetical protein CFN03_08680 [Salinicoccus roseus]